MAGTTYTVYALKYAEREAYRTEHFIGGDPHNARMDMAYYVWAVVGGGRTWVVDTGFTHAEAERRGRTMVRSVSEALATVGIDAATVTDVILTHLHYDHVGGYEQFPAATFHVQDSEMAFATGRHMTRPAMAHAFTADHIAGFVHHVFGGRVRFHDGDHELASGLHIHLVGGHSKGLQVVRVHTEAGWMVLASDASHFYENMERGRPFTLAYDVGAMHDAFDTLARLAGNRDRIVPGHDPLVLTRYPPAGPGLEGIAVRVDGDGDRSRA